MGELGCFHVIEADFVSGVKLCTRDITCDDLEKKVSHEEVRQPVKNFLRLLGIDFYQDSFSKFISRYNKCISVGGEYVEKYPKVCTLLLLKLSFVGINRCFLKRLLIDFDQIKNYSCIPEIYYVADPSFSQDVPFRITPNISTFITPIGILGYVKLAMSATARCFYRHNEKFESVLKAICLNETADCLFT
ncbi:hypothetical protein AVEN_130915-1, partial [Araneus ventricosus]